MPAAELQPQPTLQSKRCDCPGCGATLMFSAEIQKLSCEYCGAEVDIKASDATGTAVERPLEALLQHEGAKGYGAPTHALHCQQCGASINFPEKITSGACCFCGSSLVVEKPSNPQLIRPEGVLPFSVTQALANQKFSEWVRSLWFRPSNLKHLAKVKDIAGVYLPYWTFDASADTRWTAESGYYYYETERYKDSEGKEQTRQVRKTRWEPASGKRRGSYDDLLVCASKGLPDSLVRQLEPFDTVKKLQGYQASFLSGWAAEEYAVQPAEAWKLSQVRFEELEYAASSREVPGDTQRNLQISMKLSEVTWKHCLLPVYVAAYRYNNKSYRFLVNGETGKVSGEAPYSIWKILFAVLCVICLIVLFVRFSH